MTGPRRSREATSSRPTAWRSAIRAGPIRRSATSRCAWGPVRGCCCAAPRARARPAFCAACWGWSPRAGACAAGRAARSRGRGPGRLRAPGRGLRDRPRRRSRPCAPSRRCAVEPDGAPPAEDALERAGLGLVARWRTARLDAEGWRRLSLAMAVAGDPELVVLDDPWLFPETFREIAAARARGAAVLAASSRAGRARLGPRAAGSTWRATGWPAERALAVLAGLAGPAPGAAPLDAGGAGRRHRAGGCGRRGRGHPRGAGARGRPAPRRRRPPAAGRPRRRRRFSAARRSTGIPSRATSAPSPAPGRRAPSSWRPP